MPNDSQSATPISSTPTAAPASAPTPSSPSSDSGSSRTLTMDERGGLSGETSPDVDFDFQGLGLDFDPGIEDALMPSANAPATQPASTPQAAKAPVTAEVQKPAVPAAAPVPAAPTAPAAEAKAPAAAATTETDTGPVTVDKVISAIEGDTGDLMTQVMQSFQLSSDQAAAFEANPMGELPKLQAHVYMKAVTTSLQYMKHLVPSMIKQAQQEAAVHQQAESEFFGKFPTLDKAKHANDIRRFATAFASANPGVDRATLFTLVGNAVLAQHGLTGNQVPAAPAPTPQPHRPLTSSAPMLSHQPLPDDGNPFAGLGMDLDG